VVECVVVLRILVPRYIVVSNGSAVFPLVNLIQLGLV
jgi:hypothetical protein